MDNIRISDVGWLRILRFDGVEALRDKRRFEGETLKTLLVLWVNKETELKPYVGCGAFLWLKRRKTACFVGITRKPSARLR